MKVEIKGQEETVLHGLSLHVTLGKGHWRMPNPSMTVHMPRGITPLDPTSNLVITILGRQNLLYMIFFIVCQKKNDTCNIFSTKQLFVL